MFLLKTKKNKNKTKKNIGNNFIDILHSGRLTKKFAMHFDFYVVLELYLCLFVCFFCLFRATPTAYGGSQGRGRIRAVTASLCNSHSNTVSEPCLEPIPQLTAPLDLNPLNKTRNQSCVVMDIS